MGWWIIIGIVLALGFITYVGMLLSGEDKEEAAGVGVSVSFGCLWIIAQIVLAAGSVWILWLIGQWLFS